MSTMTAEEAVDKALDVVHWSGSDPDEFIRALNDRGYTVTKMTKEEFAYHVYSTTKVDLV